jgi:molecular chaperone GrpE
MSDVKKDGGRGFKVVDRRHWAREDDQEDEAQGDVPVVEPSAAPEPSDERIGELTRQLAEKERMLREVLATHQESLSDLDSARLRMRKEAGKEAEQSRRAFLVEFLDVIDNLDRALDAAESSRDPDALINGVSMVRDLFVSKLGSFGVTRLEALGRRFDPELHEAITVVPADDSDQDGRVVGVIREGYAIGNEVLRPAGVAVARKDEF